MIYAGFRIGLFEAPKFLSVSGKNEFGGTKTQHDFFCYEPSFPVLPPHKFFTVQLSWSNYWDLIDVTFDLDFKGQDHAGLRIDLKVLGLFFVFNIYDHRHWDYDNDCWEEHGHNSPGPVSAPDTAAPNNVIVYADGTGRKSGDA